jgi:hypothetical protein
MIIYSLCVIAQEEMQLMVLTAQKRAQSTAKDGCCGVCKSAK